MNPEAFLAVVNLYSANISGIDISKAIILQSKAA